MTLIIRRLGIFAILIYFCSASIFAQNSVPLPQLNSKPLMNDLQVTIASTPMLGEGMTIGLGVRYGSAFDPEGKGGLANLVSRMFLRSTLDKTLQGIQDELSYLGATVEVQSDWDSFRFIMKGSSSRVERSLLLLYQIVGEAQFTEADLSTVKQAILQDLQKTPDPRKRIHSQLESVMFRGTTYGRRREGTPQSVSAITLGDVRYFYRKFFSPGQSSLQIVGNVSGRQLLPRISRIWGVWVRNDDVPFTFQQPRKPAGREMYLEDDPSSPAAQMIIGGFFPPREDPVFVNALLASRILQEKINKLLPTSLLTVGSEGRRMASPFYIQGQAAADQAVEQIQKIENAVEEMKRTVVSNEDLMAAQTALIEEFNRGLSTTDGLCNMLLDTELYRLGNNYAVIYPDQIRRCDIEAIKQAADEWIFSGGEILLIRGPLETLKTALSPLGSFQMLTR